MSLRQTRPERVMSLRCQKDEINHIALLSFPNREFADLIAISESRKLERTLPTPATLISIQSLPKIVFPLERE